MSNETKLNDGQWTTDLIAVTDYYDEVTEKNKNMDENMIVMDIFHNPPLEVEISKTDYNEWYNHIANDGTIDEMEDFFDALIVRQYSEENNLNGISHNDVLAELIEIRDFFCQDNDIDLLRLKNLILDAMKDSDADSKEKLTSLLDLINNIFSREVNIKICNDLSPWSSDTVKLDCGANCVYYISAESEIEMDREIEFGIDSPDLDDDEAWDSYNTRIYTPLLSEDAKKNKYTMKDYPMMRYATSSDGEDSIINYNFEEFIVEICNCKEGEIIKYFTVDSMDKLMYYAMFFINLLQADVDEDYKEPILHGMHSEVAAANCDDLGVMYTSIKENSGIDDDTRDRMLELLLRIKARTLNSLTLANDIFNAEPFVEVYEKQD